MPIFFLYSKNFYYLEQMNSPPFTGEYDVGELGVVDPSCEDSFTFNDFVLRWRQGMPPNYEKLLYVEVDGESRLIGRYIKQHKVNIS